MSLTFSAKTESQFQELLTRYPRKEAALLPVLWLAQSEFGYLTQEILKFVASKLDVSLARVESVVSFYTMYKTKPMGKHHLQVCRTLSCSLRGCDKIMEVVEEELKLKPGETSEDGKFSYDHVECIAACGGAPAIQVNFDYHENLNAESMRNLIHQLKNSGN